MIETSFDYTYIILLALIVHCIGLIFSLYRVFFGEDLANRLVGIEYIGANSLSFLTIYCLLANDAVYIDIGIVFALVIFLGAVALARYIELGEHPQSEKESQEGRQ